MTTSIKIPWATLRRLAVAASVDPRTVAKVAAGEPVRTMAGERARVVLVREGFLHDEEPINTEKER